MNEILHANIFFIIASIATICFCVLASILLYQGIKIFKLVRSILERIDAGSAVIAEDIDTLRATIYEGGIVSRIVSLFFSGFGRERKTRKTTRPIRSSFKKINNNEYDSEKNDETDS